MIGVWGVSLRGWILYYGVAGVGAGVGSSASGDRLKPVPGEGLRCVGGFFTTASRVYEETWGDSRLGGCCCVGGD